jgi:hypothetical protein
MQMRTVVHDPVRIRFVNVEIWGKVLALLRLRL